MKAFIIYISSNKSSVESANKTRKSAIETGGLNDVELFDGVHKYESIKMWRHFRFKLLDTPALLWTYTQRLECAMGCFFSHFLLWKKSIELNERIIILEHDAMFLKKYVDYEYDGVVNISEPMWLQKGSVINGKWVDDNTPDTFETSWEKSIDERKSQINGLVERSCDCEDETIMWSYLGCQQYFLHGAQAYVVSPNASQKLIQAAETKGILPADAHINTDNVNIADNTPFCAYQNQTFSLIQTQKSPNHRITRARENW